MSLLIHALTAHEAGVCVLPPKQDGSKRPDVDAWKDYQLGRSTLDEIECWYGDDRRTGLGVVVGAVSGNLELLEFDDVDTYDRFKALAEPAGLGELVQRIEAGYLEHSPNGIHWLYRCEEVGHNTKLARRPLPEENDFKVLIETRGEGGFAIVAPTSGSVHPSGRSYDLKAGGWDQIVTITAAERTALFDLARTLDLMPRRQQRAPVAPLPRTADDEERPGDWFNRTKRWEDVLEPHGWSFAFDHGGEGYWRRPGKEHGQSATTNYADSDLLKVFSSSTPFDTETAYTKFAAYAVLNHGGDYSAAASVLAGEMPDRVRGTSSNTAPPPQEPPEEDEYVGEWDGEDAPEVEWVPAVADRPATAIERYDADPGSTEATGGYESDQGTPIDPAILDDIGREYGITGPEAWTMASRVVERIASEQAYGMARRLVKDAALIKEADLDGVEVITAAELLSRPRQPRVHVFGELVAEGHNATVVARWKVGKSTFVDNMARAAVSGGQFLDRFMVPQPLRVVLFNYELDEEDMTDRLIALSLDAEERKRLLVLNLRGRRVPLTTSVGREWASRRLADHGAEVVIVDPFGAAYAAAGGESENDNAEVRRFLIGLDEIKRNSGCRTLIMPVHTGRGELVEGDEQGRGATVLEDWPDVRILLTKEKEGQRFVRTEGRAWNLNESPLVFEEDTRYLSLGTVGVNRAKARRMAALEMVPQALEGHGGANVREMRDRLGELGVTNTGDKDAAVAQAKKEGLIHTHPGKSNSVLHFAGPSHRANEECPEGWKP